MKAFQKVLLTKVKTQVYRANTAYWTKKISKVFGTKEGILPT